MFLPMLSVTTLTSCSSDDEETVVTPDNNDVTDSNNPIDPLNIVVTIDENGKADGGHMFDKINDSNFNIDGVIYTIKDDALTVSSIGTVPNGIVNIISELRYNGRAFKVVGINENASNGYDRRYDILSVVIPNTVANIGEHAFSDCGNLAKVVIGDGVTNIDEHAFHDCYRLTDVYITDLTAWCKIAFENDRSNPLNYGGHLYLNGEEVTDLNIPNSVTSIGYYSFQGCVGLKSVTIPESVTSIGDSAFANCSGLTDVYCYAEQVPSAYYAYYSLDLSSVALHVPASAIEEYKTTEPWSGFGKIVPIE